MHPVLVTLPGGPTIFTYGFFLACALLSAIFGAFFTARRLGMKATFVWDLGIIAILSGVVGGRLEYVRTHWAEKFAEHPVDALAFRDGGYVYYGGLVLAVVLCVSWLKVRRQPLARWADVCAPFIPLGVAVARLGCFFGMGCCYGAPTSLPWGVVFPDGALAPAGVPLHPTQLYDSFANWLIFWWLLRRLLGGRVRFSGENFLLFAIASPLVRFANEFLRADAERGWAIDGWLTNGQATSLLMIIPAAAAWAWLARRSATAATGR